MKRLSLMFALLSLSLTGTSSAFLEFFKKDLDKVPETEEMRARESAAQAKLQEAVELEANGRTDKAFDIYRGVVKKYPLTTSAAMGQYKVGVIQKDRGEYIKAFDSFQKFVDDYKQSSAFDAAVASQYEIAKASQTGEHKETFIGIRRKVQRSEVLEMYRSVIKNAPYSDYAPQAQYAIGEVLEEDGKSAEAAAAYQKVVASYPKTSLAADAQFRIGEIGSQAIEKGSENIANVDSSRRAFEELLIGYDNDDRRAEAESRVKQFNELEAKKALEIGQFYEKQKKYKSAELYYRRVSQSTGTSAAIEAAERLAEVRAKMGDELAAPAAEPSGFRPAAAVGGAATKIREAIPRPKLGSRLFGRKKRAEKEAEEAARMAAAEQQAAEEVAAATPPQPSPAAASAPAPAPEPVAVSKPVSKPSTSSQVAKVNPGSTKLTNRKGYLGPPKPALGLAKKENRMRMDMAKLQQLPFESAGVDQKDLEKGLKKISENLPDEIPEELSKELPDDLSKLVIPPEVEEKVEALVEAEKEEGAQEESTSEAGSDGDDGEETLKIPPPPEDE